MYLLIDDVRDLNCDIIARTPRAGKEILRRMRSILTHVIFDHDLGASEDGYDVLVWAIDNGYLPDNVQLITSNPVGRSRMVAALIAGGYNRLLNGLEFTRL